MTTGAVGSVKLQSYRHRQQTNLFTGRMPFLSPNQQCQSTFVVYEGVDPYYNWLTQSRLDTFADNTLSSLSDSATGAAQSSLLFTVGRGSSHTRHRVKQPPVGPDFGKDRLGARRNTDEVDAARKLFGFSFLTVTRCSWL